MDNNIRITGLEKEMISSVVKSLNEGGITTPEEYLNRCCEENISGRRMSFLAYLDSELTGYVHVIFDSKYPYFHENRIPEINDLVVIPEFRKRGIGRMLIQVAENYVRDKYDKIGLGVGLYRDYGPAQRLYFSCGYIPDGKGLMYHDKPVPPGTHVFVDDELLIYLYKQLK